jgi:antitoxin component of RelBE/YafQ-DinJ toxin-antitoxin module
MDAFVTARVPVELKERVVAKLQDIGATQSELVNAAFAYVMTTGALPRAHAPAGSAARQLDAQKLAVIEKRLRETTFPVPEETWGDKPYKEILANERAAAYEALS